MSKANRLADDDVLAYQRVALERVSRTFALTIPLLPQQVRGTIGNAYLLCRIADTIEDEPELDIDTKRLMLHRFADVVQCNASAESFSAEMEALLSTGTADEEKDLIANSAAIVGFNQQLSPRVRAAVQLCVKTMCRGMAEFVGTGPQGLPNMKHLNRYTYYVAGVVGEMITKVLCEYSARIASRRDKLFELSSRFGRGLQLVNIMKDHNEDLRRGVAWLPRNFLDDNDGAKSSKIVTNIRSHQRIPFLVGVTRRYLEDALRFTLLIPSDERGVRLFLTWTLGLAALTLRRIAENPQFKNGDEVKVSRRQVAGMIAITRAAVRSDRALRWLFNSAAPSC